MSDRSNFVSPFLYDSTQVVTAVMLNSGIKQKSSRVTEQEEDVCSQHNTEYGEERPDWGLPGGPSLVRLCVPTLLRTLGLAQGAVLASISPNGGQ